MYGRAVTLWALPFCLYLWTPGAQAHGRLIEPPSRASMWRYGFNTPPDYNDHESYCGGFTRQWVRNGGKCGICGDAWDKPQPRAHEAGGRYGQGVIVRRYKRGAAFTIRVEITANHRGHFEFRLCKHNSPKVVVTQHCLDQHVLRRAKSNMANADELHPTWFYIGSESKVYEMRYLLPQNVTCSQCVLQWRYLASNNWGQCGNGSSRIGCGPQEEFRACADIAIVEQNGDFDDTPTPHEEIDTDLDTNNVPTGNDEYTNQQSDSDWSLLPLFIVLAAMFVAILVYALLFVYYYGANKTIKPCWQTTVKGVRGSLHKKEGLVPPLPPPRTKKPPSNSRVCVVAVT